jgi:peptidyl-dipeptidase Dcp
MWSEVFATDLFGAIQEAKSKKEVEKRLTDTLYARGGERDPTLVYKDFRGRDRPDVEYLLKYYGLAGEKRETTESSEDDESGDEEEADP